MAVVGYTAGLVAAPCLRGLCNAGQRRHILATYRCQHCKTCIYACNNQHEDYVPAEVCRLVVEGCATVVADTLVEPEDADILVELEAADILVEPEDADILVEPEVVDTLAEPGAAAADKQAVQ